MSNFPTHPGASPCRGLLQRRRLLVWAGGAALPASLAWSADLPQVIAVSKPSVVAVGSYNALDSPRFSFRGTGFAVGDGTRVVTNAHVLPASDPSGASRLVITLPGEGGAAPQVRDAKLLQSVPDQDLALLAISGQPLPPLTLAPDALAPEGLAVAMIGFPLGTALGVTPVTHRGIVAAVAAVALPPPTSRQLDARTLNRLRNGAFEIYQLDATAYPGNSGSPLIDIASGRVIGIVNMVLVKGTKESALSAPSGITYAIPVRYVSALLTSQ